MKTHTIGIIRDRGQLTIPDSIRALRQWANTASVVSISSDKPDEIVIRPHLQQIDADKIWKAIKQSRGVKGKGRMSASEFLAKDRKLHL